MIIDFSIENPEIKDVQVSKLQLDNIVRYLQSKLNQYDDGIGNTVMRIQSITYNKGRESYLVNIGSAFQGEEYDKFSEELDKLLSAYKLKKD